MFSPTIPQNNQDCIVNSIGRDYFNLEYSLEVAASRYLHRPFFRREDVSVKTMWEKYQVNYICSFKDNKGLVKIFAQGAAKKLGYFLTGNELLSNPNYPYSSAPPEEETDDDDDDFLLAQKLNNPLS